jgi:hypothetical protein
VIEFKEAKQEGRLGVKRSTSWVDMRQKLNGVRDAATEAKEDLFLA